MQNTDITNLLESELITKNLEINKLTKDLENIRSELNETNVELNRKIYKLARLQHKLLSAIPGLIWSLKFLYKTARPSLKNKQDIIQPKQDVVMSFLSTLSASNGVQYNLADKWYNEANPEVSIIILNWNKNDITIQCLHELWKYTAGISYEILLLDNGSCAYNLSAILNLPNRFRLIRLKQNRLFGEGNNIASEEAKGDIVLFLNNDVMVTKGWLEPLVTALDDPFVGACGPMFIYPDGRVQECGSFIDSNGSSKQRGKNLPRPLVSVTGDRNVHYISAACLLVRKEIFYDLNGFSLDFEPAYYEDVDLCFRIRKLGFHVRYVASSCVIHIENYSHKDAGLEINIGVEVNRNKLLSRHANIIGRESVAITDKYCDLHKVIKLIEFPDATSSTTITGLTIGLYTPFAITPGGGERYLLTIASWLASNNVVTLIFPEKYSLLRLRQIGNIFNLTLDRVKIVTYDESLALHYDIFISMGNQIVPDVPALAPVSLYICQFPFQTSQDYIYNQYNLLMGYKRYLAYSEFSKNHIRLSQSVLKLPVLPIQVAYPPCEINSYFKKIHNKSLVILSVGRFFSGGHCKNHHLLIPVFKVLLERLRKEGVTAEYHIAGSIHPNKDSLEYFQSVKALIGNLPVTLHPNIDSASLSNLYSNAHIYWHGTGMDKTINIGPESLEHFGISIVEAMSYGCVPIAYAKGGPSEIITHSKNGFLFEDVADILNYTIKLTSSSSLFDEISNEAFARANDFSTSKFIKSIDDILRLELH